MSKIPGVGYSISSNSLSLVGTGRLDENGMPVLPIKVNLNAHITADPNSENEKYWQQYADRYAGGSVTRAKAGAPGLHDTNYQMILQSIFQQNPTFFREDAASVFDGVPTLTEITDAYAIQDSRLIKENLRLSNLPTNPPNLPNNDTLELERLRIENKDLQSKVKDNLNKIDELNETIDQLNIDNNQLSAELEQELELIEKYEDWQNEIYNRSIENGGITTHISAAIAWTNPSKNPWRYARLVKIKNWIDDINNLIQEMQQEMYHSS